MLWIGGGHGAGKTTLSWELSREYDLPLDRIDSWTYDHFARVPSSGSLDEQLARGPGAAADAFESHATCTATPGEYAAMTASGRCLIAHGT
jgi:hypothetical protein